ncbi:uncharacterized protein LOC142559383 [Dermacentor variabilis]|uniref:uncharacterized protein LOC142559383 n=1 Tax=Dermacentor variabilis TaxID=34621 RepID=UPI003F5B2924
MDDSQLQDICRVCRSEGAPDKPLFHPCICTGSIKYIHQDCLVQWLKYSRKEYCELCNHRFSFMPIYSPDMPKRLPIRDIVSGLLSSLGTAIRYWLHYTVVAFAWLGIHELYPPAQPFADVFEGLGQLKDFEYDMKLKPHSVGVVVPARRVPVALQDKVTAELQQIFQAAKHRLLEGLPCVAVVMDDILLWGRTKNEHDHHLSLLLARCLENNLKLNLKKCTFLQPEVRYLGHILSTEGLRLDPGRVNDILEMKEPKNTSQQRLRDLLAATNEDPALVKLRGYAETSWPERSEVPENVRPYWSYKEELHAQDGLVFRSNKVIRELRQSTASALTSWCAELFSTHGLPLKLCSDNGPPFTSAFFKDFLLKLGVAHVTSSPYHPRSNGMTERAVQEAKKLLKKCSRNRVDFHMALLEWRNTPRDDILKSPVQRLMGRQTRTLLPVPTSHLVPEAVSSKAVHSRLQEIRQRQKVYYNRGTRHLPPLSPGQPVTTYDTLQRTWSPAILLRPANTPRSAILRTDDGREIRRTREHLRGFPTHREDSPATAPGEGSREDHSSQELRRSTRTRHKSCRYPQPERHN